MEKNKQKKVLEGCHSAFHMRSTSMDDDVALLRPNTRSPGYKYHPQDRLNRQPAAHSLFPLPNKIAEMGGRRTIVLSLILGLLAAANAAEPPFDFYYLILMV